MLASCPKGLGDAKHIDVNSLAYLSFPGLVRATGRDPDSFCGACFTGDYPIPGFQPAERDEIKLVLESV